MEQTLIKELKDINNNINTRDNLITPYIMGIKDTINMMTKQGHINPNILMMIIENLSDTNQYDTELQRLIDVYECVT